MTRFCFKKLLTILTIITLCLSANCYAFSWRDLWQRKDQQAAAALTQGHPQQAGDLFSNPQWRAVANYRAGQYTHAESGFAEQSNADGYYNQGNALAQMGDFDRAIKAYQQALTLNPSMADAKHNKQLLEKIRRQQKKRDQQSPQTKQQPRHRKQHSHQNQTPQPTPMQTPQPNHGNEQSNKPNNAQTGAHNQEQQQENEQMLRRISDNPGGLLRQKFLRDHIRYQIERQG